MQPSATDTRGKLSNVNEPLVPLDKQNCNCCGGSQGLVVTGGDLCSRGHRFESAWIFSYLY